MDGKLTLFSAIAECCDDLSERGVEFDVSDVASELRERFSGLVRDYENRLTAQAINKAIASVLKRKAGEEMGEQYEQLSIAGFENAPRNVPFYDGKRVRYISAMASTTAHLVSAVKLRDDNIRYCLARKGEYERMHDLIRSHGCRTFGEAISLSVSGM